MNLTLILPLYLTLAIVSGFQAPMHQQLSPSTEVSRRGILHSVVKSPPIIAALLAAGASPALAADVARQVEQIEKKFRDEANTNGAPEKHLPQVSISSSQKSDIQMVTVTIPHVMTEEHWIQAIWLQEEKSGDVAVAKVLPSTEPAPPSLVCGAPKGARLTPMCYCNLHGLWKGETIVV